MSMANTVKLKQSAVAGKVPATTDLALGELAVNTYDGKLFLKKKVGTTETVVDLTAAAAGVTSFNGRSGAVVPTSADVTGALGFTPANKAGDTFTGDVRFSSNVFYDAAGYTTWRSVNYQGAVYYHNGTKDRIKIDNDNFTNFGYAIRNDNAAESWFETNTTNASADNKRWRFGHYASDGVWALETVNDAYTNATRRFAVTRAGDGYLNGSKIMTYANSPGWTSLAMADLGWGITGGVYNNWVAMDFVAAGSRLIATGRQTIYHEGSYNHFTGFMRLFNLTTSQAIFDCWGFVGGNSGDVMDMNFGISAWLQVGHTYRLELQITKANGNGPSTQRQAYVSALVLPNT